jgi:hypothetical protein
LKFWNFEILEFQNQPVAVKPQLEKKETKKKTSSAFAVSFFKLLTWLLIDYY